MSFGRRDVRMQVLKILFILINAAVFILYGVDKYRAVSHRWRIPEAVLLAAAACGGSAGALLGMYVFHHKTRKTKFRIGVPLLLILHMMIFLALRSKLNL